MRYRKLAPIAIPLKPLLTKGSIVVLILASLALIGLSQAQNPVIASVRATTIDALLPMVQALSKPFDAIQGAQHWVRDLANARNENITLKQQNEALLQWQQAAHQLQKENIKLRALAHGVPDSAIGYTSARIVGEGVGPFVRSALVNAGTTDGVAKEQAVIAPEGLVGRVTEVGRSSARVLLLTDMNSRVPVMGEVSRERSILAGDNTSALQLRYVPDNSKLTVGERVVTSGDGGTFPAGLPVGVVSEIGVSGVTIKPLVDWSRLEWVSVVNFQL